MGSIPKFAVGNLVRFRGYIPGETLERDVEGRVTAVEMHGGEWYCRVLITLHDGYYIDPDDGSRRYSSSLKKEVWEAVNEDYLTYVGNAN